MTNSDSIVYQPASAVKASMPDSGPSNISSGSLLDLKAIAAEHFDRFEKEGRSAVRGQRNRPLSKVHSSSTPRVANRG